MRDICIHLGPCLILLCLGFAGAVCSDKASGEAAAWLRAGRSCWQHPSEDTCALLLVLHIAPISEGRMSPPYASWAHQLLDILVTIAGLPDGIFNSSQPQN